MWHKIYFEENIAICRCTSWIRTQFGGCDGDGKQSLPIIVCTITTSLVISYILHRTMNIPEKISTLVGVGSSICGGSAIAATAPVIDADEEEVAQAISVIFLFNILAALIFPVLGTALGFSTTSGKHLEFLQVLR